MDTPLYQCLEDDRQLMGLIRARLDRDHGHLGERDKDNITAICSDQMMPDYHGVIADLHDHPNCVGKYVSRVVQEYEGKQVGDAYRGKE